MWRCTVYDGGARTVTYRISAVARYYISSKADRGDIFIAHDQKQSYRTPLSAIYMVAMATSCLLLLYAIIKQFKRYKMCMFTTEMLNVFISLTDQIDWLGLVQIHIKPHSG